MNTMNDEIYWAIMEVGLARKSLDKALYAVESYRGGQRDDELLQIAVDYLLRGNGRHLHEAEKTMNELVQEQPEDRRKRHMADLEDAFAACDMDGTGKVAIGDLMDYAGKSKNTVKNWVDEHPGYTRENGVIRRVLASAQRDAALDATNIQSGETVEQVSSKLNSASHDTRETEDFQA